MDGSASAEVKMALAVARRLRRPAQLLDAALRLAERSGAEEAPVAALIAELQLGASLVPGLERALAAPEASARTARRAGGGGTRPDAGRTISAGAGTVPTVRPSMSARPWPDPPERGRPGMMADVPGVGQRMPFAASVAEARATLRRSLVAESGHTARAEAAGAGSTVRPGMSEAADAGSSGMVGDLGRVGTGRGTDDDGMRRVAPLRALEAAVRATDALPAQEVMRRGASPTPAAPAGLSRAGGLPDSIGGSEDWSRLPLSPDPLVTGAASPPVAVPRAVPTFRPSAARPSATTGLPVADAAPSALEGLDGTTTALVEAAWRNGVDAP